MSVKEFSVFSSCVWQSLTVNYLLSELLEYVVNLS